MAWDETVRDGYRRSTERSESDLTDREWHLVEPLSPPPLKLGRRPTVDLREIRYAIQHMLATRCRRRAVPTCLPPVATVRNYFHARRDTGVSGRMLDALRAKAREQAGRSAAGSTAGR